MKETNEGTTLFISSRSNPKIAEIARLDDAKYRRRSELFIVDGIKLFREAVLSGYEIKCAVLREDTAGKYEGEVPAGVIKYIVTSPVFEKLTSERAPEGIIGVVGQNGLRYVNLLPENVKKANIGLILDGVQNPENLGAILRSANAFGIGGVLIGSADNVGAADPFGRKAQRASMGAAMKLTIYHSDDLCGACRELGKSKRLVAACLQKDSTTLDLFDFQPNDIAVIGNEGHGISDALLELCREKIYIPMQNGQESLNAASAAAVMLWEMYKSRKA